MENAGQDILIKKAISDVQNMKFALQKEFQKRIQDFEEKTGLSVKRVELFRSQTCGQKSVLYFLQIETVLE